MLRRWDVRTRSGTVLVNLAAAATPTTTPTVTLTAATPTAALTAATLRTRCVPPVSP